MNSFLDLAFSLITSPRKAMVVITNSEKLKEGFFFWIFVVLLMAISAFREGPGLILQFALLFLGMGTALLCHSAAIDYISGMWGGMGTAKGITAGFMAASLPLGFSVFFMLIGASGVNEISSAGTFILSLWAFYLDVLAISENYRFSTAKAFAVAVMPYALLVLAFVLLAVLAVLTAAAGIRSLGRHGECAEPALNAGWKRCCLSASFLFVY